MLHPIIRNVMIRKKLGFLMDLSHPPLSHYFVINSSLWLSKNRHRLGSDLMCSELKGFPILRHWLLVRCTLGFYCRILLTKILIISSLFAAKSRSFGLAFCCFGRTPEHEAGPTLFNISIKLSERERSYFENWLHCK